MTLTIGFAPAYGNLRLLSDLLDVLGLELHSSVCRLWRSRVRGRRASVDRHRARKCWPSGAPLP